MLVHPPWHVVNRRVLWLKHGWDVRGCATRVATQVRWRERQDTHTHTRSMLHHDTVTTKRQPRVPRRIGPFFVNLLFSLGFSTAILTLSL